MSSYSPHTSCGVSVECMRDAHRGKIKMRTNRKMCGGASRVSTEELMDFLFFEQPFYAVYFTTVYWISWNRFDKLFKRYIYISKRSIQ